MAILEDRYGITAVVVRPSENWEPHIGDEVTIPRGSGTVDGIVLARYGDPENIHVIVSVSVPGSTGEALSWTTTSVGVRDVERARPYRFVTVPIASTGAFDAAMTRVDADDGAHMVVITRVSYTRLGAADQQPIEDIELLSAHRARHLLTIEGFQPGKEIVELLTTFGWSRVQGL